MRSELEKKRLTLHGATSSASLPPVIADREKLSAVLENLVINAIKFTPEGGPHHGLGASRGGRRRRARGRDPRRATRGIGIPADQIGKIFNRFHQVDGSTTRRFGGVGLGLAIVKSILEAHGATIDVESEAGKGTVFRFGCPLLEQRGGGRGAAARASAARRALVLVVDDDDELTRRVSADLKQDGLSVIATASAVGGRGARGRAPSGRDPARPAAARPRRAGPAGVAASAIRPRGTSRC